VGGRAVGDSSPDAQEVPLLHACLPLLVIYCVFLKAGSNSGLKSLSRLEYDTEQQVLGNHLLCAWETLEEMRESSRKAHTRSSV
jgi:hypothetical protein